MVAVIKHAGSTVAAIDMFCGYGGSSQGIHKAGADIRVAANHKRLSIDTHAANFPWVDHWCADLVDEESSDYIDPADLPPAQFGWFSPGCKDHTQSNALKLYEQGRQSLLFDDEEFDHARFARSERSRMTMACVLRYISKHRDVFQVGVVENVVEVCHWGPGRDSSTFRWWVGELKKLGYEVEPCFFNSMFFPPCPQSRDRIYIVIWKRGLRRPDLDYRPTAYCTSQRCGGRIVKAVQTWKRRTRAWPLERWGKYGRNRQYVYTCPDCRAELFPAAMPSFTAIDWSNLGVALGERAAHGLKPLAPATVERIRRGMAKFRRHPPIVIPAKSVWGTDHSVFSPFSTQTTQQDKALVVGGVVAQRTHNLPVGAHEQVYPVTTSGGGGHALVSASVLTHRNNTGAETPCGQFNSLTSHADISLASILLPAAGNTYERGDYVRARHVTGQMFTQHTSQAFGVASMPFLLNGQDNASARAVGAPGFAVRADGSVPLVTPYVWAKFNGEPGDTAWHLPQDPFNTVTTTDTHGVIIHPWVEQFLAGADSVAVTEQLATVMTHLRHACASVEEIPADSITDDDLMTVRFRMLTPDPELRRVMAFAEDYVLLGNITEMTAGLGNAVTPPVAEWITERCLATLRG